MCDVTHPTGELRRCSLFGVQHRQVKRRSQKKAADLTIQPETAAPWAPPPDDECECFEPAVMVPPDADPSTDRIIIRTKHHAQTLQLVDFAVIQQTFYRRKWREVAKVDSSHVGEVHLHRYMRSADERPGGPEVLCSVSCGDDVTAGYELAYSRIVADWAKNKAGWHDG